MDIIDIILAKALTPQGKITSYAAASERAVQRANAAVAAAQSAVNNIETITEQTTTNNETAASTLEDVTAALQSLNNVNIIDITDIRNEIKNLTLSYSNNSLTINYPDGTSSQPISNIVKLYSDIGTNADGAMTQAAIKSYVESVKTTLEQLISSSSSSSSSTIITNLGSENAGKIVIVGADGNIAPGTITEDDIRNSSYTPSNPVYSDVGLGLEMDYANKSYSRTEEAVQLSAGSDFNSFTMYGGRVRCNVNDNGEILAFEGQSGFASDGSNGQVMVYQPKFYYRRIPLSSRSTLVGRIVLKDSLIISGVPQTGFKLHPLFKNGNEELDYVLLSAYEGGLYDTSTSTYWTIDQAGIDFSADKLSSVAGVKPISGQNNDLTVLKAEQLATNRGTGWHITNMAAESANQMLQIIEFGMLNGQNALEEGIVNLASSLGINGASLTGSTASLGNSTGAAMVTINEKNGTSTPYMNAGERAISYRGYENPWGNLYRFIAGTNIVGNGSTGGGIAYICSDFNYDLSSPSTNYHSVGFNLPSVYGWISNLGYGEEDYDWVLLPALCQDANSAIPIGDKLWTSTNLNDTNVCVVGGIHSSQTNAGPYYYGCDKRISQGVQATYGARLMFIPTKNATYNANITKWTNYVGG